MAAWSAGVLPDEDAVGRSPERYARSGELGRGGMGVVEAAVDTWLQRTVAVKRPRATPDGDPLSRLAREARLTATLVHPSIPPVYDVGEDDQGPYYTMPVLDGATLHERLAGRADPLRVSVAALARACRAVGAAHARGVVHRDLKPANLLLGAHGEVWVLDWGVALDPRAPDAAAVGTPGFRPPEAERAEIASPAWDVFSLGRTLAAVLAATPARVDELDAVVARATRDDPKARYADAAVLADELDRWLDGHLVDAYAYPVRAVVRHLAWRWRAPLIVGAAALVGLAVLGAGAWRAQQAERRRADRSLSVSLTQQADALRRRGARPESEVLAAHALALAESPAARGVLAVWAAAPVPALVDVRPRPCERPRTSPDGHLLCEEAGRLRLFGPDGTLRWDAVAGPPSSDVGWVGDVVDVRHYADGALVLRRASNHVEVWRDGTRTAWFRHPDYLRLADGDVPAVHDTTRLGLLAPDTGAVSWGPPTCARIETAWVGEDAVLIGCRDPEVHVGTFDAPGPAEPLPGHPSASTWADVPVVGTFEGQVLAREADGWRATDARLGAVRQLLALDGDVVALRGEHRDVRLWSISAGAALASLPRGASALAWAPPALWTVGGDLRRWTPPPEPRAVVLDRAEHGGISTLAVSPSGAWVVAGSASGEVVSWQPATGLVRREQPPGNAAAKGLHVVDESTYLRADPARGLVAHARGDVVGTTRTAHVARDVRGQGERLALLPWGARVVLLDAAGAREVPLPAPPVGVVVGEPTWVADERGGVHTVADGVAVPRFTRGSPPTALAATGELLVLADGAAVVAVAHDGAERWRHDGGAPISALDASGSWVVAGDLDGRVRVLTPEGRLVASLSVHTRRVSGVVLRGDRLFTASWDGAVRVARLDVLRAPVTALVDDVAARWRLSRDEAQAGADGLGGW